jgi:hypothetical protein
MIRFIKNIWFFRKELWNHVNNDYSSSLMIFKRSLELMSSYMEKNYTESFIVQKRVSKMKTAIELINRIENEDYFKLALEKIHDEFKSSPAYKEEITFGRSSVTNEDINKATVLGVRLEENDWVNLWTILKDNRYGLRTWWWV